MKKLFSVLGCILLLTGCGTKEGKEGVTVEPYKLTKQEESLVMAVGGNTKDVLTYKINGNVVEKTGYEINVTYYENGIKRDVQSSIKGFVGLEGEEKIDSEIVVVSKNENKDSIAWTTSLLGASSVGNFSPMIPYSSEGKSQLTEKKQIKKRETIVLGVYARAIKKPSLHVVDVSEPIEQIVKENEATYVVTLKMN